MISTPEPAVTGGLSRIRNVITGVDPDQQARLLDLKSFKFRHSLGNLPELSIPAIRELTRKLLEQKRYDQIYCRNFSPEKKGATVDADAVMSTLDSFETAGSWLRLTRVDEINAELGQLCETFYSDLSKLLHQDIRSQVMKTFVTLFISSPGALTPYHLDHTWNFLLQIGGHKVVHLFDLNDPRVLSQQNTEAWYWNRYEPKQDPAVTGTAYDLAPGEAAHHPVNAPHWVQNGKEISVSLSFGLCLHASNDDAKVHQFNFLLRKLGLKPIAPGQSEWRDKVKKGAMDMLSKRDANSFDDVVYSGQRRMEKILKAARIVK